MHPVTDADHVISGYAALAIVMHLFESAFPMLVPGVKPGLSNIITLIVLFRYNLRYAIWVSVLRVLVGSLLMGTFLSPTFFMSAMGTGCSLMMLFLARFIPYLGIIGYSVLAAIAHIVGQFSLAYFWLIPDSGIIYLLPVLVTLSLFFGVFNGFISAQILIALEKLNKG